jgi:hypothetical protein
MFVFQAFTFLKDINIAVWILSPGKAEVRGLTKNGVSSRWGSAERSTKDKACWIGEDFQICVY